MATLRVLPNHRVHPFCQPIKSAAHVGGFAGHPDPRPLRTVHRLQARQPDHPAASTTASNPCTCSASNPRPTSRLRPFCSRTSIRESPATSAGDSATCTSKNFVVLLHSRFFHTKKYGRHRPRSPQNAVTVCPLRPCSATSLRHFAHAFFVRLVMSQLCSATESFTRCGSCSAHDTSSRHIKAEIDERD